MQSVAWSCRGCGALVEPQLHHCHRCGARRDAVTPADEELERGTPAEFITAVYRSSIEPLPPPHGPIEETVPAATELAQQRSRTIPEVPILVPPPRAPAVAAPPPEIELRRRWSLWRWVLLLLVPGAIVAAVIAYLQIDEVRELIDGIVDAIAR